MPPTNRRGELARAALVTSAERLFAERGLAAVSLRDVCAAAGQRNHSAAQYHFGDREGLVAAVYDNRMRLVDGHRHALLAELDEQGRGHDVHALIDALVRPLVEVVDEAEGSYARFLARTRWDPAAWDIVRSLPASAGAEAVMRRLDHALGTDLAAPLRRSRLDQLLTLVLGTVAGWEGAPERGERRLASDLLVAELVATGVAVLTAPVLEPAGASSP